jgi:hypothetical protein
MCAPLHRRKVRRPEAHDFFRCRIPEDELPVMISGDQSLDHAIQYGLEHDSLGFQGLPGKAQLLRPPSQVGLVPLNSHRL